MTSSVVEVSRAHRLRRLVGLRVLRVVLVIVGRWLVWPARHRRWWCSVVLVGCAAWWLAGQSSALLVAGLAWWCPSLIAVVWAGCGPVSFDRLVAGPGRRRRWKRWARRNWSALARDCGLAAPNHTLDGTSTAESSGRPTGWRAPRLLRVSAAGSCLSLLVRTRSGQTVEHLEAAAPLLRDAAAAHTVRTVCPGPGLVRFELGMRELLTDPATGTLPVLEPGQPVVSGMVRLGRCESGADWLLPIAGRHTLIAGCSGSGKGSVLWGVVAGLAPGISARLVRMYAIDLKYGVELGLGAALFTATATDETTAVQLLHGLHTIMAARGAGMAGHIRAHQPTIAEPLLVLVIDELATLTAYVADREVKREADRLLRTILTKGRALGVVVVGALQDPAKETVPMRGLFTQTIALRLRSREEVTMVLGEGQHQLAPAHRIPATMPGTGYLLAEDGSTQRVRADFWPDLLVRQLAGRYPTDVHETLRAAGTEPKLEPAAAGSGARSASPRSGSGTERRPRTPRKAPGDEVRAGGGQ